MDWEFYDKIEWKYLSWSIKRLYGRKCMKCRRKKGEMHTDHIKPRSKYPELELDPFNMQVLCKKCNLDKLNLNEKDYRKNIPIDALRELDDEIKGIKPFQNVDEFNAHLDQIEGLMANNLTGFLSRLSKP